MLGKSISQNDNKQNKNLNIGFDARLFDRLNVTFDYYTRRTSDVSVPVWLVVLSDQLPIVALVSLYLTN